MLINSLPLDCAVPVKATAALDGRWKRWRGVFREVSGRRDGRGALGSRLWAGADGDKGAHREPLDFGHVCRVVAKVLSILYTYQTT